MTRISNLQDCPFEVCPLPRDQWKTGDYVVGEIVSPSGKAPKIELTTGRMVELLDGDLVIGAFGIRRATLEVVGDWQHIEADGRMEALSGGGIFGKATSVSFLVDNLPPLVYGGHVLREKTKVCMKDFVPNIPKISYQCPTLLMVGTSMSCGKTTTARVIIHHLNGKGLKVIGTKLAGAGRYHDILTMKDAGAEKTYDFIDVGLPSSICPREEYRASLQTLLSMIAAEKPDLVVAEVGASPFEPYNGSIVLEEIKEQIVCTVMCASDPYAVVGLSQSFGLTPDVISGIVTNTSAGIELVEKLTGVKAVSISDRPSQLQLMEIVGEKLKLSVRF
jgi:hypothetical protein